MDLNDENCIKTEIQLQNPSQVMVMLEYPDGTVIRCFPQGNRFRKGLLYCIEIKKDSSKPCCGIESIAFRVDTAGDPIPKLGEEIKKPLGEGPEHDELNSKWEDEILEKAFVLKKLE